MSGSGFYLPDPKNIMSFQLGAFFSFDLSDHFAIQPEIYYVMRGTRTSAFIDTLDKEIKLKLKVDYIDIPVLLKFKIPVGNKIKPFLFIGPYMGIRLNARSFYENLFRNPAEVNYNTAIQSQYVGLVVGGGFEFKLKSMKLILEGRYNLGISGINSASSPVPKEYITEVSLYPTHRSFVLMFGIGI